MGESDVRGIENGWAARCGEGETFRYVSHEPAPFRSLDGVVGAPRELLPLPLAEESAWCVALVDGTANVGALNVGEGSRPVSGR